MCSIGGFISEKPLKPERAEALCKALLYYGAERGEQSSGVFVNDNLLKKAVSPDELINLAEFEIMFTDPVSMALTHTRQPTSGGLGDDQAQPFKSGNTITVHNGFFHNIKELKNQWSIQKQSGVDSELVTQFIDSYGIEMLPKFLASTYGSSAFGIIHKNEMYLMRESNPISVASITTDSNNKIIVFASTPSILSSALKFVWLIPASVKINQIKEGILFKVTPSGLEVLSERVFAKHWYGGHGTYSKFHDYSNNWPAWANRDKSDRSERFITPKGRTPDATYEIHKISKSTIIDCHRGETD